MLHDTEPAKNNYDGTITGWKMVTAATFMVIVGYVANAVQSGDWTMSEAVQNALAIVITAVVPSIYVGLKNFVREARGWKVWKSLF